MKRYSTFAEIEALLQTAIGLPGHSIKEIAEETGINASTLSAKRKKGYIL